MTPEERSSDLSRRELLIRGAGIAGTAGAAAILGQSTIARAASSFAAPDLPKPRRSGIKHVVVLMMENRSFDHFLGWLPRRRRTASRPPVHGRERRHDRRPRTSPSSRVAGTPTPTTRTRAGALQYANGACDGFAARAQRRVRHRLLHRGRPSVLRRTRRRTGPRATATSRRSWPPTYPNRFYMHAAQTDRLHNGDVGLTTLPTIWDRLADAGLIAQVLLHRRSRSSRCGVAKYLSISHKYPDVPRRLRERRPARGLVRRSQLHQRRAGHCRRRPSALRHPCRPGLPQPDLRGDHEQHGVEATPCSSSTTTSGAGSSTTSRRGMGRDADPDAPAARLPRACRRDLAVRASPPRRAPDVRPHVDPQDDRVAVGSRPADAARRARRATSRRCSTSSIPNYDAPSWSVPPAVGLACPTPDPAEFADWMAVRDHAVRAGFRLD